jgi:hypothetical protein
MTGTARIYMYLLHLISLKASVAMQDPSDIVALYCCSFRRFDWIIDKAEVDDSSGSIQ